jgi:pyruvate dehydrogenase (quinone)
LGNKSGFEAMHKADVLVMLGTDFPYSEFLPEKCKIIQIDTKPERLGRRAKVDFGYCGDIKSTLQELMPMVDTKKSTDFLDKMRSLHQEIEDIYNSYVEEKGSKKNIHPEYVAYLVDKLADDDAIFTVDTGMSAVWAARYLKAGKNNGKCYANGYWSRIVTSRPTSDRFLWRWWYFHAFGRFDDH